MSERGWAVLLALAAACDQSENVRLDWPPVEGAASVLVAVGTTAEFRIEGLTLHRSTTARIQLFGPSDLTATIEVLAYEETLETLGLPAAEIPPGYGDVLAPLPPPASLHGTRWKDGGMEPWRLVENPSPALAAFRIDGEEAPCPFGGLTLLDPPRILEIGPLVATSSVSALIGTALGEAFLVSHHGFVELDVLPRVDRISAADREEDGTLWFMADSCLMRGHVLEELGMLELEEIGTSSSGDRFWWLDVVTTGTVTEAYAQSTAGIIERFDGERWHLLGRIGSDFTPAAGVARVRANEAVFINSDSHFVHRYRDGQIIREPVDLEPLETVAAVEVVPGIGTLVATNKGRIFKDVDGVWELFSIAGPTLDLSGLLVVPGGFIALTRTHEVLYHYTIERDCTTHLPGLYTRRMGALLHDALVLTARNLDNVAIVDFSQLP